MVFNLAAIKVGIIVSNNDSIPDKAPLVLIGASIAACNVLAACMIVPPLDMPPDVISDAIPAAPKADTEAEAAAAPRPTAPAPTVPTVLIALIEVCIMPCTTAAVCLAWSLAVKGMCTAKFPVKVSSTMSFVPFCVDNIAIQLPSKTDTA